MRTDFPDLGATRARPGHYKCPMNLDEIRRDEAERIRAKHRRPGDDAAPARVTVTPSTPMYDVVRIEYADGEVREFERLAPIEGDGE